MGVFNGGNPFQLVDGSVGSTARIVTDMRDKKQHHVISVSRSAHPRLSESLIRLIANQRKAVPFFGYANPTYPPISVPIRAKKGLITVPT
jgi:hypothetical protein